VAALRARLAAPSRAEWAFGLAGPALALLLAFATAPPPTVPGPRVLLVQPGFTQERKQGSDPRANFRASRELTLRALEEATKRGEPPPDLVCWGESMLYLPVVEQGLEEALAAGARPAPWSQPLSIDTLRGMRELEEAWVQGGLFGFRGGGRRAFGRLPDGTSLLAGAEVLGAVGREVRRRNAVVLYDAEGRRTGAAGKLWLVPGAETMYGLERFGPVRGAIDSIAGYLPDFVAEERTGVLALETRAGSTYRLGATVCFDDAFLEPYLEPLRRGPLDFHVVVSNEAWYRESCELDQMIAFARLAAIASGRSIVRATNSGVSAVLAPDGSELGRIESGGRDRAVAGTLALEVPVPAPGADARTPVVRLLWPLRALWIALPFALALLPPRSARDRRGDRRNRGPDTR
jgi:apolipoprotein N-acyltransferase